MSICTVRLRNTSNALTLRMSDEQIRLQVPPKFRSQQLDCADDQAVSSRQFVRRQKMQGSQKCCGELAELTVDEIWQIADAGNQELRRLTLHSPLLLSHISHSLGI